MVSAGVAIPISSALLIFLVRLKELGTRRETIPGPVRETITLRLFLLAGALMCVGGIAEFFWRHLSLQWVTFALGWACVLSSFGIRRWAISALGKFWSLHVEIRPQHEFVTRGPFRWLRHPTYFSMILEIAGGGLILNAFYTLAVAGLIFVPTLAWRVRLEEEALVEKFGAAYQEYQRRTPSLFPYKRPRSP
ncbi:MAG: isoprenylcysteine carboxylmethyltransferase family protein [Verrucomicrobia bacterium]|nr:isoprenylcysteine carboxylmethyltransferase family protein [Verrucomicrobiota bacterium]